MDTLVSAQPGLVPQMSGFLMNLQTWGATVFVDHFSDYVFCGTHERPWLRRNTTCQDSF
jgi:hypothetical protein